MALDIRELLRRLRAGQSVRAIRNATGTSRKAIARYREIAELRGWLGDGPLPELAEIETALKELAPASSLPPQPFTAAPFEDVITRLRQQGVEMKAIHQRLQDDHGYTNEHSLPVLATAHIQPYADGGAHEITNGLLLRADLHRLYDAGYVTITPDDEFRVSPALRDEYANGRIYCDLEHHPVHPPRHHPPARQPRPPAGPGPAGLACGGGVSGVRAACAGAHPWRDRDSCAGASHRESTKASRATMVIARPSRAGRRPLTADPNPS